MDLYKKNKQSDYTDPFSHTKYDPLRNFVFHTSLEHPTVALNKFHMNLTSLGRHV